MKIFTKAAIFRLVLIIFIPCFCYLAWTPGVESTKGQFDKNQNALWVSHGWFGDAKWLQEADRSSEEFNSYSLDKLVKRCHENGIAYVYPHCCPANSRGKIPNWDDEKIDLFLTKMGDAKVLPWVGGVFEEGCFPNSAEWRKAFLASVSDLLEKHPRLDGIHLNIEPLPSGHAGYLLLLEELKAKLGSQKMLSVAAYPPPTAWHPHSDLHWDQSYYKEISARADQIVPMLYDTALQLDKVYIHLVQQWTKETVEWSGSKQVILGLPAYEDEGVGYHQPHVENLTNALRGANAGIMQLKEKKDHCSGIALYADWTISDEEWLSFRKQFRKQ